MSNRALGVQGKWGHNPKASFILAYSEIVQGPLCQTSGCNSLSLRGFQHEPSLIPDNEIPGGSRVTPGGSVRVSVGLTAWQRRSAETLLLPVTHRLAPAPLGPVWRLSERNTWALGRDYWFQACDLEPPAGEASRHVQLRWPLLSLPFYPLGNWFLSLLCDVSHPAPPEQHPRASCL